MRRRAAWQCFLRCYSDKLPPVKAAEPEIRITQERPDTWTSIDGERKTVTALFADIKGSMELIEDLDPEEARSSGQSRAQADDGRGASLRGLRGAIDRRWHLRAIRGADRARKSPAAGTARVAEDAGRPQALRKQAARRGTARRSRFVLGLNTGEMVVRSVQTGAHRTEYTPIGHSTSLAARMQALAPTGSIAVSGHTQKLVEGYFAFKALGPTLVKGVSEPVNVFKLTGLGPLRTRLQMSVRRGLSRVRRPRPRDRGNEAGAGKDRDKHWQLVAAIGEAGLGKSRLFFEFKAVARRIILGAEDFLGLARQGVGLSADRRAVQRLLQSGCLRTTNAAGAKRSAAKC